MGGWAPARSAATPGRSLASVACRSVLPPWSCPLQSQHRTQPLTPQTRVCALLLVVCAEGGGGGNPEGSSNNSMALISLGGLALIMYIMASMGGQKDAEISFQEFKTRLLSQVGGGQLHVCSAGGAAGGAAGGG